MHELAGCDATTFERLIDTGSALSYIRYISREYGLIFEGI